MASGAPVGETLTVQCIGSEIVDWPVESKRRRERHVVDDLTHEGLISELAWLSEASYDGGDIDHLPIDVLDARRRYGD